MVFPLSDIEQGPAVQVVGQSRVHRLKRLFQVCTFLLEVQLRLRISPTCYRELGQTIESHTHQWMLRLWHLLPNVEGIPEKLLCPIIFGEGKIDISQSTKGADDRRML